VTRALRERSPTSRIVAVASAPAPGAASAILASGASAYVRKDLQGGLLKEVAGLKGR
jgi:DNA-binding NarL/FixJ family response regulator